MTRAMGMSMHRVTGVRVKSYYPGNSHSVSVRISNSDGVHTDIDMYGMEEAEALRVVAALADADTVVYDDSNKSLELSTYLTERYVFKNLEGK